MGYDVTLAATSDSFLAYSLLEQVLDTLAFLWTLASDNMRGSFLHLPCTLTTPKFLPLSKIPALFNIDKQSQTPNYTACTRYPQFLSTLQEWVALEGLVKEDIGTHSLRRGLASESVRLGISGHTRSVATQSRSMESEIVADGYIDESINIQMQLRACHYAAQSHI